MLILFTLYPPGITDLFSGIVGDTNVAKDGALDEFFEDETKVYRMTKTTATEQKQKIKMAVFSTKNWVNQTFDTVSVSVSASLFNPFF